MFERRIQTLEEAHRILDKQIDGLEKTGAFSDEHLNNLKKQRLHYRDEIAKLRSASVQSVKDYFRL